MTTNRQTLPHDFTTVETTKLLLQELKKAPPEIGTEIKDASTNAYHQSQNLAPKILLTMGQFIAPAIVDLPLYGPDTIMKRMMVKSNNGMIPPSASKIAFIDPAIVYKPNKNLLSSIYDARGLGYSTADKLSKRFTKYYTQEKLENGLTNYAAPCLQPYMDEKTAQTSLAGVSGFAAGALATSIAYPLGTEKVKCQVNMNDTIPESFFKNVAQSISKSQTVATADIKKYYNGLEATAARDGGTTALFFGAKQWLLHGKENPTKKEKAVATVEAGMVSTSLMHPVDVLKTQLQASKKASGVVNMGMEMLKKEGPAAFMKGFYGKVSLSPMRVVPFLVYDYFRNTKSSAQQTQADKENNNTNNKMNNKMKP